MSMPGDSPPSGNGSYWGGVLIEAMPTGGVPLWRLDDMVVRILAAFYKVGRETAQVDTIYSSWTNETVGPRYRATKMGIRLSISTSTCKPTTLS
ncbi:hypothetical protein F5X99DRAFT_196881 [Biscogniauxia marginata]|nr:hypothetical protein F5X99DRAFT_196881 [Biscogniauxia marginata]